MHTHKMRMQTQDTNAHTRFKCTHRHKSKFQETHLTTLCYFFSFARPDYTIATNKADETIGLIEPNKGKFSFDLSFVNLMGFFVH